MTEEEQEAQATDLENSLAAELDQDSARENETPIETTTSNFRQRKVQGLSHYR